MRCEMECQGCLVFPDLLKFYDTFLGMLNMDGCGDQYGALFQCFVYWWLTTSWTIKTLYNYNSAYVYYMTFWLVDLVSGCNHIVLTVHTWHPLPVWRFGPLDGKVYSQNFGYLAKAFGQNFGGMIQKLVVLVEMLENCLGRDGLVG